MNGKRRPIRFFVSPAGINKLGQRLDGLTIQRQSDARTFIDFMAKTSAWAMPDYRPKLKGHSQLGELRWTSEKTEHRLIGFFHGGGWVAVMGCTHKGRIYNPSDALDTAEKRRKQIVKGEADLEPYEFSG